MDVCLYEMQWENESQGKFVIMMTATTTTTTGPAFSLLIAPNGPASVLAPTAIKPYPQEAGGGRFSCDGAIRRLRFLHVRAESRQNSPKEHRGDAEGAGCLIRESVGARYSIAEDRGDEASQEATLISM